MGLIRVSATELKAKAQELASLNSNYKTNTSDLEASEQNLMTMWDGEAKDAFHQAFTRDKIQMDNFSTLIDKYVATLQTIAAKYEQAESTNVNTATTRTYN
jgi:WXG100 family type VII secretion target